ncbi:MAG TPA: glycosyltransferase, partial [Solirubrobacteraceae bacterium]
GLVVEEAMVAGLPVICTTSAGDIATRLPDGEAGFVIAPEDSTALEQAMLALADDAPRRRAMGARAQQLGSARDHARYAEDFEAFIAATLARPPRRTPAALLARAAGHGLALAAGGHACAPLIAPAEGPSAGIARSGAGATL